MASAKPSSIIRIRDITPADIPACINIHFDAFASNVLGKLLSPNGASQAVRESFGASLLPPPEGPNIYDGETITKVAELFPDEESNVGEVIAFGKWQLHRHPRTEDQWNVDIPLQTMESLGEGSNPEVHNAFLRELHILRRDLAKGDPVLILKVLCTAPKRWRLGAGWALLTWGTAFADQLGLQSRLEASPPGYPLYKKAGYLPVGKLDLEVVKRFGGIREEGESWGESTVDDLGPLPEGTYRTALMRRPAKVTV